MNFYDLMNKFKCDKTEDYTHVSMLPHGGLYKIPDEEMETFYGDYSRCIEKKAKFGILERPTDIGPMLVDVDIVKESKTLEILHTKERTIEYARCFQKYLLENTSLESVDCWVLEKKPYLDGKGNCKNGFHLHFPTVWMSRIHRSFITQLVKDTCIEQEYETLDDSAVRNNWFLYGSRKTEIQGSYRVRYIVETDGTIVNRRSRSTFVRNLSIRYNSSKIATSITNGRLPRIIPKPNPKQTTPLDTTAGSDDDRLLSRCMDSLDSSRADDYHSWIKIGCILYTIDKENGFQRWDEFSKQSYKYDESYVSKIWRSFKDYNYTIGSLIYLAREDDEDFVTRSAKTKAKQDDKDSTDSIVEKQSHRKLIKKCKEKGIRGYMTMSFEELCSVLDLPKQKRNEKCKNIRSPVEVTLVAIKSGERINFKSIYSAAKFIGKNPGSVTIRKNTTDTLKSVFDGIVYRVEV